jgi:hypothetical protein
MLERGGVRTDITTLQPVYQSMVLFGKPVTVFRTMLRADADKRRFAASRKG